MKKYQRKVVFAGDSICEGIAYEGGFPTMHLDAKKKVVAYRGLNTVTFHTKRIFKGRTGTAEADCGESVPCLYDAWNERNSLSAGIADDLGIQRYDRGDSAGRSEYGYCIVRCFTCHKSRKSQASGHAADSWFLTVS